MNGRYGVPGGHVEPGESASEAAIRETLEESGIHIANGNLSFSGLMHRFAPGEPLARVDIFFTCHKWEGSPTIAEPDKFDDLRWLPIDAPPVAMVPYVAAALEASRSGGAWYREFGWADRG
jgi:8-oxo-dGTP pyrophosphatase MutT (NUDIX family)